jgi:hypothetical protein
MSSFGPAKPTVWTSGFFQDSFFGTASLLAFCRAALAWRPVKLHVVAYRIRQRFACRCGLVSLDRFWAVSRVTLWIIARRGRGLMIAFPTHGRPLKSEPAFSGQPVSWPVAIAPDILLDVRDELWPIILVLAGMAIAFASTASLFLETEKPASEFYRGFGFGISHETLQKYRLQTISLAYAPACQNAQNWSGS